MNKNCTIFKASEFIGKKWTLSVLLELYKGKSRVKRYSEIKRRLPRITPKILSARLKELEKNKLLKRKVDTSKFPIKTEYWLTESGEDFIRIIRDIKKWALKWNIRSIHCSNMDCSECGL